MECEMQRHPVEIGNYIQKQRVTKDIQKTVASVHDWLLRANFYATRKFFLGILHRIDSLALLRKVIRVLSALKQKDFTYSRSQCNSSLLHERNEFSSNKHGVSAKKVETQIAKFWDWFSTLNDDNKTSFVFCIAMVINNSSILHQALNLAKTVYIQLQREKRTVNDSIQSEASSLASTTYTFCTDEHPDVYLLAALRSQFKASPKSLFSQTSNLEYNYDEEEFDDQSSVSTVSSHFSSISSFDPRVLVVSHSKQATSGVAPFVDYVSKLPIHLAKNILSLLDMRDQCVAAQVCKTWHDIVHQVQLESRTKREISEEAVMMQGVSAKGAHPNYAKNKLVTVPIHSSRSETGFGIDLMHLEQTGNIESSDYSSVPGLTTSQFEMEERNVYCGSYNVLILDKRKDKHRVVHYSGGKTVASGSKDRTIRLFDINSGREIFPSIRGHPGSITSLFVADNEKKYIFSGSYDTTIRRWHVGSSSFHQLMHGHHKSIVTLDYFKGTLVSGSKDGLVKVWDIKSGKCVCTFKHANCSYVTSVKIHQDTVVSACDRGMIKVWNLADRKLVKQLVGHSSAVAGVSMDAHYIVSASHDEYVLAWVRNGNINKPIKSYRHPKKVLCVELRYLRIISGCADGKIRVLHLHTGECMRVVRGNSNCDPILSICATLNRLIVNTESNLLLLQFEPVELKYDLRYDQATDDDVKKQDVTGKFSAKLKLSNSYVRACRNRASSTTCSNIRNRPISAPVRKEQRFVQLSKRPFSSFPSLIPTEEVKPQATLKQDYLSSRSSCLMGSSNQRGKDEKHENRFNVHDSAAMSVVSGISSRILQEEAKLDEKLSRRSSACSSRQRRLPIKSAGNRETPLSRERLHLRIGSVFHNTRSDSLNINTALNGGHPDVRELYHACMEKNGDKLK